MKQIPLPFISARLPRHICLALIISMFCLSTTSFVSADIITNFFQPFCASDGSCALLVHLYDTVTSNHCKGSLTIFDKNNNKLVDEPRLGGYSDYTISDYSSKCLLQRTSEGLLSNQCKFILYKVSRKGLKKINEQVVNNAAFATIKKSFIPVYNFYPGSNGFTVFNNTLKKVLYYIPPQPAQMFVLSDKGIIVAQFVSASAIKTKYYKRGKLFAEHQLPMPSEGGYTIRFNPKCGLLYWLTIGPFLSPTNLPLTYVDAKGTKKCDNVSLPDAEIDWRSLFWNGKYLYILNQHAQSIVVYKLTKTAVKIGEVVEPDHMATTVDGSFAYLFINDGSGNGLVAYDCKLKKIKWSEPCNPGNIMHLGDGVFSRTLTVDNGMTGYDTTLTLIRKGKTIATHSFTRPY